jgi:hypothetical protein
MALPGMLIGAAMSFPAISWVSSDIPTAGAPPVFLALIVAASLVSAVLAATLSPAAQVCSYAMLDAALREELVQNWVRDYP